MAEELNIISDKDLQAPLALGKNYNQLADDFEKVAASATKVTKSLEDGASTTSQHRETSKQLAKAQQDLEKANDRAAKSQKKYAEATHFADEKTGGMISKVKDLGKQFTALLSSGIGAFFLLIAGAVVAIGAYFRSTNEGADKFENIMSAIHGVVDFLTEKFADLGKEIFKLFEEGNALGTVFGFVFDQIINRIAGAIDFFTNLIKVINVLSQYSLKDLFTGNLKPEDLKALKEASVDMGKSFVQTLTGIGNAADEAKDKIAALQTLLDAGRELEDATAERILTKAQALLDIEEQMFIFKDKGNHTDQQRLEALQKAIALSEQQLKIDIDLATRKERIESAELLRKNRIISTDAEANEILRNGVSIAQDRAFVEKAFGEDIAKRRQLQADIINLETNFFSTQKKNIAQLAALQKEIDEESIKRAQIETDARVRIFDAQLKAAKEVSGQEILGLKTSLGMQGDLNTKFNKRIVDETKQRLKEQEAAEKEHNKRMADELRRQEEERRAIAQAGLQAIALIGNEFFARRQEELNAESSLIEENRKKELEGAGDDATKKLAINRKFDREQAKIKQKQAQADKQNALFQILISTAMGIARVAPNPVLIALVAAIGAIQGALVASRPLPKFWKGTQNAPDSFVAGDRGRELVTRGREAFVAEKPTIFTDMAGAKVFTKAQTDNILGDASDVGHALNYGSRVKNSLSGNTIIADRLYEGNRLLKQIARKPAASIHVDEYGFSVYLDKMDRRNQYVNKMFRGR